ncbi:hypothetical protein OH77DRAFT_1013081 [Trametes cingulata]|nr:hypothetical protein OH77DRAFT_1013081 [Trametes cingulata]
MNLTVWSGRTGIDGHTSTLWRHCYAGLLVDRVLGSFSRFSFAAVEAWLRTCRRPSTLCWPITLSCRGGSLHAISLIQSHRQRRWPRDVPSLRSQGGSKLNRPPASCGATRFISGLRRGCLSALLVTSDRNASAAAMRLPLPRTAAGPSLHFCHQDEPFSCLQEYLLPSVARRLPSIAPAYARGGGRCCKAPSPSASATARPRNEPHAGLAGRDQKRGALSDWVRTHGRPAGVLITRLRLVSLAGEGGTTVRAEGQLRWVGRTASARTRAGDPERTCACLCLQ